jgi:hypothetical protein
MCALLFGEKNVFESDPQIDDLPSVYFASDGDNKALVIDGVFVDTSSGSSFNLFEVVNTDVSLSVEDYKPAEHFVRMGYDSQTDVITIMSVRSNGNERRTILVEATREDWARATHLSQFEAHLFAAADTAAYAEIAQRSWEWISEHTTEMLDATQHGLTLAGMAPAAGALPDMANLVINVGRRQWSDAGMDAMGIGLHLYMIGVVVETGGLGAPLAAEAAAVNIAMRAPRLAKAAKAAAEVGGEVVEQVLKKVPNPGGRLGDQVTRDTTKAVQAELEKLNFKCKTEQGFEKGLNGVKTRFADIVATHVETMQTLIINIGKKLQSGLPISRERKALADINLSPTFEKMVKDNPDTSVIFIEKGSVKPPSTQ